MTLVLQPSTSGRDLISSALATDAEQAAEVLKLELFAGVCKLLSGEVRVEGSEELETSGGGRDGELSLRDRLGECGGKVGGVTCERECQGEWTGERKSRRTSSEASGWKLVTGGRLEAEGFAISADELVLGGVEAELAGESLRNARRSASRGPKEA